MSKTKITQLLILLAVAIVGVLLILAPKKKSVEDLIADEHAESHEHSAEETSDSIFKMVNPADQLVIDDYLKKIEASADDDSKSKFYDSLIQFSIQKNYPPLVAKYAEGLANLSQNELSWFVAGDYYFKAFRLSKNQVKEMVEKAIFCYNKVLEFNENNLQAETAIGVAYVEGYQVLGVMPMKGIGILTGILNKDPKNIDALTNLGYFAIQSGQFEKAIERFQTILEIDSLNAEAYLYLTDIYLSQEQPEQGIKTLEKYKSLIKDPLVIQQVEDYIKDIETNNKKL